MLDLSILDILVLRLWLLDILIAGLLVLQSGLLDILCLWLDILCLWLILVLSGGLDIADWLCVLVLVIGWLCDLGLGDILSGWLDIGLRSVLCGCVLGGLNVLSGRLIGLGEILLWLDVLGSWLDVVGVAGSEGVDHLRLGGLHIGHSLGLVGRLLHVLWLPQRHFHLLRLRVAHRGIRWLGVCRRWLSVRRLTVAVRLVALGVLRLEILSVLLSH